MELGIGAEIGGRGSAFFRRNTAACPNIYYEEKNMTADSPSDKITEAHVEAIIDHWGELTLPQMAEKLGLELAVVEDIVAEIRKLRRVSDNKDISPLACLSSENIKSIVRCVGAKRGFSP